MNNIQKGINQMLGSIGVGMILFKKRQDALKKSQEKFQAKQVQRKQRRNFLDYIKNEPTNLGVNVGNLSLDLQKQIAKSYSSEERRKIMNKADKEAKNNV